MAMRLSGGTGAGLGVGGKKKPAPKPKPKPKPKATPRRPTTAGAGLGVGPGRPRPRPQGSPAPKVRRPSRGSRGIIAQDYDGSQVLLAGPVRPDFGNYEYSTKPFDSRVVTRAPRLTPELQGAGFAMPGFGSYPDPKRKINLTRAEIMAEVGPREPGMDKMLYDASVYRKAAQMMARREAEDAEDPWGVRAARAVGDWYSDFSNDAVDFIHALPAGSWNLMKSVALPGLASTNPVVARLLHPEESNPVVAQIRSIQDTGKAAYDIADQQVRWTTELGKDLVTRPAWTVQNRSFDTILGLAGVASGTGAVLGAGGRTLAATSRMVNAAQHGKTLAAKGRIAKGYVIKSREYGPPSPTPRGQFRYVNAAERKAQAVKAAEVTGNRVGGRVYDAMQRLGDWSSRSPLPGSRRHREDRTYTPPQRDAGGNDIRYQLPDGSIVDDFGVIHEPRRPRSTNPVTRAVQARITDRVGRGIGKGASYVRNRSVVAPALSRVIGDSYNAAAARRARNAGYLVIESTDQAVANESQQLIKTVRRLRGSGSPNVDITGSKPREVDTASAAAMLRAAGAADDAVKGGTWGRDNLIRRIDKTLASGKLTRRERADMEKARGILQQIPDEYLDIDAPQHVKDLEAAARQMLDSSSETLQSLGVISYGTRQWSRRRTQAALLEEADYKFGGEQRGARPFQQVRDEAYGSVARYGASDRGKGGPIGPRADSRRARMIEAELAARDPKNHARAGHERNPTLAGYKTEALRTLLAATKRRQKVLAERVTPRVKEMEARLLEGATDVQEAQRVARGKRQKVKDLERRRDTSAIDAELAAAREARNKARKFARQRSRARARMAAAGDRYNRGNQRRRQQERHRAERQEAMGEVRAARESHRFEVQRAETIADRIIAGDRVMAAARARRARAAATAGRARAVETTVNQHTRTVQTVFNAGERKGKAGQRVAGMPPSPIPGKVTGRRGGAYGTQLRADGALYVAKGRAANVAGQGVSRGERIGRQVGRAEGQQGNLSPRAKAALREANRLRGKPGSVPSQVRPAWENLQGVRNRQAAERGKGFQQGAASKAAAKQAEQDRGLLPREARRESERVNTLARQRAAVRAQYTGTSAQLRRAEVEAREAAAAARKAERDFLDRAWVDADIPEHLGMEPGSYFPHEPITAPRPPVPLRKVNRTQDAGAGGGRARLNTRAPETNEGRLIEAGNISLSPAIPGKALREAKDAEARVQAVAGMISDLAVKGPNGVPLTGGAAKALVDSSNGMFELVTARTLLKVSRHSSGTPDGDRLVALMDSVADRVNKAHGDTHYAVPAGMMKGWNTALGPAAVGRTIDWLNSLWKGGQLALNPRWYVQNMIGMWGQFVLGAGADLQAISMAADRSFVNAIPGRISASGLADDLGEYARRMSGRGSNPAGALIRKGFEINAMFEAVPRRAMFWAQAKRQLKDAGVVKNGYVESARIQSAWLEVTRAAAKGDAGANAIIDDAIRVTERFMGNYSRFNSLEKNVLRRIFPFYSWMRAIHRLAFALPVKHPKRTAVLLVAAQAADQLYNINQQNDLLAPRVGMAYTDTRQVGGGTFNMFESITPTLQTNSQLGQYLGRSNLTDPVNLLGQAGRAGVEVFRSGTEQAGPLVGLFTSNLLGRTARGIPIAYTPGEQGVFPTPTGRDISMDSSGNVAYGPPPINPFEQAAQQYSQVNMMRRFFADGRPYANASTWDLFRYWSEGRPANQRGYLVVNDPKTPRMTNTDGVSVLSNFLLGVPLDTVDRSAVRATWKNNYDYIREAIKTGRGRIAKGNKQGEIKKKKGNG